MEPKKTMFKRFDYSKVRVVHWKQFKGYKFYVKPLREMITRNYYAENKRVGNKSTGEQDHVTVIYDRDYVAAYFAYHFADILRQKPEIYQNQLGILLASFIKCSQIL